MVQRAFFALPFNVLFKSAVDVPSTVCDGGPGLGWFGIMAVLFKQHNGWAELRIPGTEPFATKLKSTGIAELRRPRPSSADSAAIILGRRDRGN